MKGPVPLIGMLLAAFPVAAQDLVIYPAIDSTAAIGIAGMAAATEHARRYYGVDRNGKPAARAPVPQPHGFARPAPGGVATDTRYPAPSAQFRQQQVADFVARTRKSSPANADALRVQLARHDYAPIYDGITRQYGLSDNDAANALAAYMLLGWTIVHNGEDASPAGVQGVRAQAAQALSNPRLSSPEMRAKLGEEFKILFVTLHAGWQSARREGNLDRYADGVAQLFQKQNGTDLRATRIGRGGFEGG